MLRRITIACTVLVALLAISKSIRSSQAADRRQPQVRGRKNTVLFLTDSAHGLSNVHVATAFSLLEHHSDVEVHYASFAKLRPTIEKIASAALKKNAKAGTVIFHNLIGGNDFGTNAFRVWGDVSGLVGPPGRAGVGKLASDMQVLVSPWDADEHWQLYSTVVQLIEKLDPGVIVLDPILSPAMDAARNMNRVRAIVAPNALSDAFVYDQPNGGALWKYPPLGSGHPFPVPWHLIPMNIYLQLRLIIGALFTPKIWEKRKILSAKGVQKPINFFENHQDDVPWLSMAFPEAGLPMDFVPANVTCCGPIVLDVAPVEDQDADLAAWLRRAPTVLIILGSEVKYDEQRAAAMVQALESVLRVTKVQVLWKFQKLGEYNDDVLTSVKPFIASERLRMETWLHADPVSLLESGQVELVIHHGGANCFYEAVLSGVPQVILPLWFDLYNFARIAEYLGIGYWPGKELSPKWNAKSLGDGILEMLTGNRTFTKTKARELSRVAKQYRGRDLAADIVAQLAATGH